MADAFARLNVLIALKSAIQDGDRPLEWLKKFSGGLVVAAGAMVTIAAKSIELAGKITDLANAAGLSTQAFQTFAAVGSMARFTMEDIAKAGETLRRNLQEAAENGASPLNQHLATLGKTAVGLQALAPERQWEEVARAVATAADKQAALNAAGQIFGTKQLAKMKEFLDVLGTQGFDKLTGLNESLRIEDKDLEKLDEAGDKLTKIATQLKVIGAKFAVGIFENPLVNALAVGTTAPMGSVEDRLAASKRLLEGWENAEKNGSVFASPHMTEVWRKNVAELEAVLKQQQESPHNQQRLIRQMVAEKKAADERKAAMDAATAADRANKKAAADSAREMAQAEEEAESKARELMQAQDEAAAVVASVRTPTQEYNDELRKLRRLLDENLLSQDEFNRAVDNAKAKLAGATTIPGAQNELNERLLVLGRQRAALESDFTKTSAEKWEERRRLLNEEIAARERLLELLQAQRAGIASPEAGLELDAQIRGVGGDLSGLRGDASGMGPNPNDWLEQMHARLTQLRDSWGTTAEQIGMSISGNIAGAIDATSSSIAQALVVTGDWAAAWDNLVRTVGVNLVQSFVTMGTRWIATKLMMAAADKLIGAGAVAATAPMAMAQSAIWAAPATLATIATLGAAAAQAPFSIAGAMGLTQLMSAFPGFADGGRVPGGKQLAWLNEEGEEFVFSAPAARNLGFDNLEALHRVGLSPSFSKSAPDNGAIERKSERTLIVDFREQDLIERILADPRFETKVRRIGRRNQGDFGSPT